MKVTYREVIANKYDAGLYRGFIAQNYGSALKFGATSETYRMARKHYRCLARMIDTTVEEVVRQAVEDDEIIG